MSVGYYPKDEMVQDQSLRVQELVITGPDSSLYQFSGGNCFVMINEPVQKVFLARVKVDSSNTFTQFQQASLVICDSNLLTAGGNLSCIEIVGLSSLATLDCLIVNYSVLE